MTTATHHQLSEKTKNDVKLGMAHTWDILRDAARNYTHNGDVNQAAAIAFYAILSLIPFFLLTLLAAGYIFGTNPHIQKDIAEAIKSIHPFFSEDILVHLAQVQETGRLLGGIGIISLVWFSTMIFGALEKALNIIFRTKELRNILASKLLAIAMMSLGWIVGITSMGITYIASIAAIASAVEKQTVLTIGNFFSYGYLFVSRSIMPYLLTIAFVTLVYRIVPKGRISLHGAVGGAIVFSTLLEIAKFFLTWYMTNHTRYDIIFGSMETVVLLVLWVFYIAIILLYCAELVSSYERRDLILLEETFLTPKSAVLKTDERLLRKFGRFYPRESYLFREGDTGSDMFYIISGRVRVEKGTSHGGKMLAEIGPGSYLGEMAALINAPRTASAYATQDSNVAVISGNILRDVLRESEGVSLFMLQEFSHRIVNTNFKLEELTQIWIRFVVVLYLTKEWPIPEERNPREELVNLTGKTTGEIDDVFAWLQNEHVLHIRDGRITGFAKDRLWEILETHVK